MNRLDFYASYGILGPYAIAPFLTAGDHAAYSRTLDHDANLATHIRSARRTRRAERNAERFAKVNTTTARATTRTYAPSAR